MIHGRIPFESASTHGFVRVAAAIPRLHLGDADANATATVALVRRADAEDVTLVVFPELGMVGYSNQDLFHQEALLAAAVTALGSVQAATAQLRPMVVVGLPLRVGHQLFNAAVVVHRGRVLGVVPKSYLPNYREVYEKRHFSAGRQSLTDTCDAGGSSVPFGTDLLFTAIDVPDLTVAVEICEDLWAPVPPST